MRFAPNAGSDTPAKGNRPRHFIDNIKNFDWLE
jgi:hypothetical protein